MATGRTVEELLEQLIEITAGGRGPGGGGIDPGLDLDKFREQVKNSTESMKKSFTEDKKFANFLKGNHRDVQAISKQWKDTAEGLDHQLEELEKRVVEARGTVGEADARNKKVAVEEQKQALQKHMVHEATLGVMNNFGLGVGKIAEAMTMGAVNLAKNLQSGASGVDSGSQLLLDGVATTKEATGMVGTLIGGFGSILTLFKGKFKLIGYGLELLGIGIGVVGDKLAKISEEGIKYLQTELKNTVETFTAANRAGALYADGMTGVRNAAFDSGMTMKQFGSVVTENSATLAGMGLSVAEGAKKMGQIMKAGGAEFTKNLRNLGYSVEEQATMVAETMKIMRGSGGGQLKASDAKVAEQTEKYAENLRVIAAITGEDAKKKAEIVKEQASQLAFQQKLAQKSPEQRAQIDRAMQNMTEVERKNFMDMVNFGTVINTQGAIMEAASPALGKSVREMKKSFDEGTLDENKTRQIQGQYNPQQQKELLGNTGIAQAQAAGVGGVVGEVGVGMGKQLQEVNARTPEAIKAAEEAAKNQKTTSDTLTKSVTDLETANQNLAVELGKVTTGALTDFANGLQAALRTVEQTLDEMGLGDIKKSKTEKDAETGGQVAGGLAGGALGAGFGMALGGPIGAVVGGAVVGYLGEKLGGMIGGTIGKFANWLSPDDDKKSKSPPKMAAGGITQGQSIVGEAGPEAVVPLPNQKAIPVILNAGNLADQLTESLARSQSKQGQQGYGADNTSYDDLPREMQSWIKTRMQYDSYKKMTEESVDSKTHISVDPAHKAKMDSTPKYLDDQSTALKEKYGRDIAQEYRDMQAKRTAELNEQQKKIYGNDINAYYSKLDGMTKMAKGGITKGPSIAGEAGPEAVIPLVGGAVPVTLIDKSFLLDSKKPDASFEEIKSIIKTTIPPVGMISRAVDFFIQTDNKKQDGLNGQNIADISRALNANINDKMFQVGQDGLAGQSQDTAGQVQGMAQLTRALNDKSFQVGQGGLAGQVQDTAGQAQGMAELSRSLNANINDKMFQVGKDGLAGQAQGMSDLSRSLDNNINDRMFRMSKDGLADQTRDPETNFRDIKRIVEIAIPPVGMISRAVDFFTKPVEKQQDPLSGPDLAKALNDKSFLVGKDGLAGGIAGGKDGLAGQMPTTMPDSAKYQAGGFEADRSMPKSGLSDTNFDTSKLLDAASPMLGMLSKAISTIVDNKNTPNRTTNADGIDPGTDMGLGMGTKANTASEATDAMKQLPGLLKAMISRSDDQLQELRATRNIQQQIANNH